MEQTELLVEQRATANIEGTNTRNKGTQITLGNNGNTHARGRLWPSAAGWGSLQQRIICGRYQAGRLLDALEI